jgi:hypothetical protein
MYRFLLACLFLFAFEPLQSQNLSVSRTADWSNAGLQDEIVNTQMIINVLDFGAFPNGDFPNDSLIQELVSSVPNGTSATLLFPAGDYLFEQTFSMGNNLTLMGESADSTRLLFDLSSGGSAIHFTGSASMVQSALQADAPFKQKFVLASSASLFQVGDWLHLVDNDSHLVTSCWAFGSTGQIMQITQIHGDTLFLGSELRRTFNASSARVKVIHPLQNASVENLTLIRVDEDPNQASNFYFNYTQNCALKCVQSYDCNKAHVNMYQSAFNEVSGCYFQDAHDYGSGGKAYGVLLQNATSECLVTNNNFKHLRHSMILQAGANGNVFSYNYSTEPNWSGVALPANSAGDIVLHGNYPYLNLFEGNVVQHIVIDDSHGANGKFNTFFRNRAELYGIFMNYTTPSDSQNFIGNEIPNTGLFMGNYYLSGSGHYEYGNNHRGNVVPANTQQVNLASLYLDVAPSFYSYHNCWPAIGYPNALGAYSNEAQFRRQNGILTTCDPEADLSYAEKTMNWQVTMYPNPCKDILTIESQAMVIDRVLLRDVQGKLLLQSSEQVLNLSHLPPGLYLLELYAKEKKTTKKLMKH